MGKLISPAIILVLLAALGSTATARPRIWVHTDLKNSASDPDDWSCLAWLFLFANEYDIVGITAGLHQTDQCASDVTRGLDELYSPYAIRKAWEADRNNLHAAFGGFPEPESIKWYGSDFCPHNFSKNTNYTKNQFASVKACIEAVEAGPLHLLIWGGAQEAAVVVKYLKVNNPSKLANLYIIGHMTGGGFNVNISPTGHAYLAERAAAGDIRYSWVANTFESQLMISRNCPNTNAIIDRNITGSHLSQHMLTNGTWTHSGSWRDMPDASDFMTVLLVMGYCGGLCGIPDNGTQYTPNTRVNGVMFKDATCKDKPLIAKLVTERLKAAAGQTPHTGNVDYTVGECGQSGGATAIHHSPTLSSAPHSRVRVSGNEIVFRSAQSGSAILADLSGRTVARISVVAGEPTTIPASRLPRTALVLTMSWTGSVSGTGTQLIVPR